MNTRNQFAMGTHTPTCWLSLKWKENGCYRYVRTYPHTLRFDHPHPTQVSHIVYGYTSNSPKTMLYARYVCRWLHTRRVVPGMWTTPGTVFRRGAQICLKIFFPHVSEDFLVTKFFKKFWQIFFLATYVGGYIHTQMISQ